MKLTKKFWDKVEKTQSCWIWKGAKSSFGYGRFKINGKLYSPHRMIIGEENIPKGLFVCHKCDNPSCVNPTHLFIGSRSDNMKDALKKNRLNIPEGQRLQRGNKNPFTKLTNNQVLEIKNSCDNPPELAKKFGISKSLIYKIKSGLRRNYLSLSTTTRK